MSENNKIIGIPKKLGLLEIAQNNFSTEMDWHDAKVACKKLGIGWRLPTKDELNKLYQNKEKIGGFDEHDFWSSTEEDEDYAWYQCFSNGYQDDGFNYTKDDTFYVRAVRNFISPQKIIGTPIKIGKVEFAQFDYPDQLDWNEAKAACAKLGNGWRLPDKDELNHLYNKKNKIDCFNSYSYWSSTEQVTDNGHPGAWYQEFTGRQTYTSIEYNTYFRAVRTI